MQALVSAEHSGVKLGNLDPLVIFWVFGKKIIAKMIAQNDKIDFFCRRDSYRMLHTALTGSG